MKHPLGLKNPLAVSVILLCCVIVITASAASAVPADNSAQVTNPDVLVLVLSNPGLPENVAVNYNSKVTDETVQKDIANIIAGLGADASDVNIVTSGSNTPQGRNITSAAFSLKWPAGGGLIRVEPFVIALKRYRNIWINFLGTPASDAAIPPSFENRYLIMSAVKSGNALQMKFTVKNPGFDRLAISRQEKNNGSGGLTGTGRILLIVGIALVGAVLAYFVSDILAKRSRARD